MGALVAQSVRIDERNWTQKEDWQPFLKACATTAGGPNHCNGMKDNLLEKEEFFPLIEKIYFAMREKYDFI
jgi:hypothetical protein